MSNKVIVNIVASVATITLNYPEKHNIFNPEMISALSQAYAECENNSAIQIIVLNANGKHFCAGADLQYMLDMGNDTFENNRRDAEKFSQLFYQIYSCKKPTIACGHGNIRGGGLGLLCAHDFAFAAHNSSFSFSEVKLGLVPAIISPYVLQRLSRQHAKYFMLSAEIFDASKALEIQLIDKKIEVIDSDELHQTTMQFAKLLCENTITAMQATKKWLNEYNPITTDTITKTSELLATMRASAEAKMLITSFLT